MVASNPDAKIVFLTLERDPAIVAAALATGARGFVLKSRAARDLLPALAAILRGETFVSDGLPPAPNPR